MARRLYCLYCNTPLDDDAFSFCNNVCADEYRMEADLHDEEEQDDSDDDWDIDPLYDDD